MKSKDELIDQMVSEMPFVFNEKMRPYIKELMGIWGMLIIYGNAQQSQPSGMRWVRVEDYKCYDGRILVFSPIYPIGDPMRYRIIDSQFLKTCKDVTHYHILKEPSESSPAGAAEGAREGMAEALRKDIFRLDELRRFHIEPYNLGEMGEVSKIISRLSKLASLSPGVEDGSGWVKDETISDGFGGEWLKKCPDCGKDEMAVVRPGKVQCNNCG